MLSQGNRAMQRVFPTPNDFDCYLIQVLKGQGLANMRLSIRCSHSLPKSRLNVKLKNK